MLSKKIIVTIKEAKLKRRRRKKGDEETGDLLSTLKMETPLLAPLAKDLGAGAVALLKTKDACEPKLLPFVNVTLPDKPEGLRLTVFDVKGEKFSVDGCKVKKLRVLRDADAHSKAVLAVTLQVPPMPATAMTHLNNAVGNELEVALVQPQGELGV